MSGAGPASHSQGGDTGIPDTRTLEGRAGLKVLGLPPRPCAACRSLCARAGRPGTGRPSRSAVLDSETAWGQVPSNAAQTPRAPGGGRPRERGDLLKAYACARTPGAFRNLCFARLQGLHGMCLWGTRGRRGVSSRRQPRLLGLGPQPAEKARAWGNVLTRLDGQEVVELVQQLQQGRLLLGLTELEGHRTRGQQGVWARGLAACRHLLSHPVES